ncbi:hypothetical protein GCK72_017413 [Caenorhabditis remanei]|uniref:Tyrosine-protein phosphatase domain-containing protein n=1 Tax=Caenorhabditis remanei TaxID=31234 RepID=A0A6A5G873_CAERE|nr:hypothetical protein GCK72_017413 [Caenorhabditis remanei]KAF1750862.1 hypothetical protein GCK72_017413 [Caenorhabditis remanei]
MADTLQTNGKATALAIGTNRMSVRSTRKKKTTMLSPKKFCDFVIGKTPGKSFEAGVAELYKEYYLESPTFINYFRAPKEKNASESVWLYDQTRVIVPDLEYYHASWVEGLRPNQYILAQAPRDAAAAKDFFKMVDHVKAEAIIIAESSDEFSSQIAPKFEKLATKKGEKGTDDLATADIKDHGKNLKAVKFNRADQMTPAELVEMVERTRKYLGSPLKGPTVIICRDGATSFTRCNTFDTFEAYDFAINSLVELCIKHKKK